MNHRTRLRKLGLYGVLLVEIAAALLLVPSAFPQGVLKGHPALESILDQLDEAYGRGGLRAAQTFAELSAIDLADSGIRVVLETSHKAKLNAAISALQALGGRVELTYEHFIQALVPLEALEQLANMPEVRFIRLPVPLAPAQGSIVSQGVSVIRADEWQKAGITGKDVKVAVLDIGFRGLSSAQRRGELPANIVTRSFRTDGRGLDGGTNHGTAVAEVIYDVAPGVQFFFANLATDIEFFQAVDWAISQKVDVINTSIGRPPDCVLPGDSFLWGQKAKEAREAGILWASSAGNAADVHWAGEFSDDDGNGFHNFLGTDETNTIEASSGEIISLHLIWDDPCRASSNDYDLFLLDNDNKIVARSEDEQNGNDQPRESLSFRVSSSGLYHIKIKKAQATRAVKFDLFIRSEQQPEYVEPAGSIIEPALAKDIVAVGATFWRDDQLEPFSSQGRPGEDKPNMVAPDGVTSATFRSFFGTSASSPHVAGAAALVKQAFPNFTPAQIQKFLEERAEDLGPPGKDNQFGAGRLNLGPVPAAITAPKPPRELVATALSPSQIELRWEDDSDNEDGFKIERRIQGGDFIQIAQAPANTTSFIDGNLTPKTTYCYRVRAFNAAGDSPYSNEACATTLAALPTAPSELVATAVSPTQINLRWKDNSEDELGFKIERKIQGGEFAQIAILAADVTSFPDTELTPNTTYGYRVRAFNAAGDSPYSNEAFATTPSALRVLALRSGEPVRETAEPGPNTLSLTQYTLEVLPGVRRLVVRLRALGNLDLHLRFGKPVEVGEGKIIADASSAGPTGLESLELSSEELQIGTYYVAIENQESSPQGYVLVGAVVPQIVPLALDTPVTVQLAGVVQTGVLEVAQYLIEVPSDAKRLTIKLENEGIGQFNAYIRFGQSVELVGGQIVADRRVQMGLEGLVTLTLEGEQLKAGHYYVAFENLEPYAQRFTLLASLER